MAQGTVKDYADGAGTVVLDDGTEVAFEAPATSGQDVRFLRPGQRVAFDLQDGAVTALRLVTF